MSKYKKINWVIIGCILVVNIVFYFFLPKEVAVKFSFTGKATRFMAKEIALLIVPGIAALINIVRADEETGSARTVLVNVILFVVNLGINIRNLFL